MKISTKENLAKLTEEIEKLNEVAIKRHLLTLDKDKKAVSIEAVLKQLADLQQQLQVLLEKEELSLNDFDLEFFKPYLAASFDKLKEMQANPSYQQLKLDITVREKLAQLQDTASKWHAWYKAIPLIHRYLVTHQPVAEFSLGINQQNFAQFIASVNNFEYQQEVVSLEGVAYDTFKAAQLNNLLEHTWQEEPHVSQENNFETITISGSYIRSADIARVVIPGHTKNLKVACFGTIELDSNLQLPGANVAIIAPRWKIGQAVTIDLSGKNGPAHSSQTAISPTGHHGNNGKDGNPGLPGLPGQHAGSFQGKGQEFIGLNQLTVKANGGSGGPGQHGSNGGNGLSGAAALPNTVDGLTRGGAGGRGGNAGAGGKGGLPGHAGKVSIMKNLSEIRQQCAQVSTLAGTPGQNGNHGIPGTGGKNGDDYYYKSTPKTTWVRTGKHSGYNNTTYDIDSKPITNNTSAPNGQTAATYNAVGQASPGTDNQSVSDRALAQHFAKCLADMFKVDSDEITFKVQRKPLKAFAQKAVFGASEFGANAKNFWQKFESAEATEPSSTSAPQEAPHL